MWLQKKLTITRKSRGFHLVTGEIAEQLYDLNNCKIGILNLHLQHTSASLCINENADASVRRDMERYFLQLVPDANTGHFRYEHDDEGPDDMPAHIKAVMLGTALSIPVSNGKLALGTWQGIYLGEHREYGGERSILATLHGSAD